MKHTKRILSLLLALVLVLSLLPTFAAFAEDYGFRLCGVNVTSANAVNILGDGKASYNSGKKTLYLSAGTYSCDTESVIYSQLDGLNIIFTGNVTLQTSKWDAIGGKTTSLFGNSGNEKVTMKVGSDRAGIRTFAANAVITINDLDVTISGGEHGITGNNAGEKLNLEYAKLKITASKAAVNKISGGITLDHCDYLKPAGVTFDGGTLKNFNGSVAKDIAVGDSSSVITYGLKLCGYSVTSANKDNVLGDGEFSYNVESRTLSVSADVTNTLGVIDNEMTNLILDMGGKSIDLKTTGGSATLFTKQNMTITNGTLNLTSGNGCVFVKDGATLTVKNAMLFAQADFAVRGNNGGEKLVIDNSELDVESFDSTYSSIYNFSGGIELKGCKITYPVGGQISGGTVLDASGNKTKVVQIEPTTTPVTFNLKICGTPVTSENCNNVLGDGKVVYYPTQKVLYIQGSYTSPSPVIESEIDGLIVYAKTNTGGVVTLTGTDKDTIITKAETHFDNCNMIVKNTNSRVNDTAIYAMSGELWFKDSIVEAVADYTIWGGAAAGLHVQNSTLKSKSESTVAGAGAIGNFNNVIELKDCQIVKPVGGKLNTAGNAIAEADGTTIAKEVEIARGTSTVNPFSDIKASDWYYDSVLWAYYHTPDQITNGMGNGKFEPGRTCTRGHIVTFLWRAFGCEEPSTTVSPFSDVQDSGKWYYKAVLWANEKNITNGMGNGKFEPDRSCTRGHAVTFIWRAEAEPAPSSMTSAFSDVQDSGKWYYKAVLWANEKNITNGMGNGKFEPDRICTRGHIVTFLYRDKNP